MGSGKRNSWCVEDLCTKARASIAALPAGAYVETELFASGKRGRIFLRAVLAKETDLFFSVNKSVPFSVLFCPLFCLFCCLLFCSYQKNPYKGIFAPPTD